MELKLCSGRGKQEASAETWALLLHFVEMQDVDNIGGFGDTAALRPQKVVWRMRRKEPADRRCLSSFWKEEARRRGMHLC